MTRDEAIKYAKENILAYTSEMAEFKVLAIEALEKMKELEKGLEDLEDTLNDAYTFSLKVMQNLSWLLGVIKGSDADE